MFIPLIIFSKGCGIFDNYQVCKIKFFGTNLLLFHAVMRNNITKKKNMLNFTINCGEKIIFSIFETNIKKKYFI